MKVINLKSMGDQTLRLVSSATILLALLLAPSRPPHGVPSLLLAGSGVVGLAVLTHVLAGRQLAWYRRVRGSYGMLRRFLFSVACSALLFAFWTLAGAMIRPAAPGYLVGMTVAVVGVAAECPILFWKRDASFGPDPNTSPSTGDARGSLGFGEFVTRNLLPLATYAFVVAFLLVISFLLFRDVHDLWQGDGYWWVEAAAVASVVPFAFIWVVAVLSALLGPRGEREPEWLFRTRTFAVPVMLAVCAVAVACGLYQWFGEFYGRYRWLGIIIYVVAVGVAAISMLRILIDRGQIKGREVIYHLASVPYAILWLLAESIIVRSYPAEKWLHAPEFLLFSAVLFLEFWVSAKALYERGYTGKIPVWEKKIDSYRFVGVVFTFLTLYSMDSRGGLGDVGRCLASIDPFVLTAHGGMTHAVRCLASAGDAGAGYSTILSNGVMQTLLGVVTIEYFIAFRAATRERDDEPEHDGPREGKDSSREADLVEGKPEQG